MMKGNKFIAPGSWFSMIYPAAWHEFNDDEEAFLFYNPTKWDGNFRITVLRGERFDYGMRSVRQELSTNRKSKAVNIGDKKCAYSLETFTDEGKEYDYHQWIIGIDDLSFEVSFTTTKGGQADTATEIIKTIEVRKQGQHYPAELITIRLSEIVLIDEAFNKIQNDIKKLLKKDLNGKEADIPNIQALLQKYSEKKSINDELTQAIGIVLCVILTNEVEGPEWRTLIDGKREVPVLVTKDDGTYIDPANLISKEHSAYKDINLMDIYNSII